MPDNTLPANVDAEESVLGSVLLDNKHYPEVSEDLNADDFSLDSHRRIFRRVCEMLDAGRPVDLVTLTEELDIRRDLQAVGDVAYVGSLVEGIPDRPSIASYVKIVRDKAMLRNLIRASQVAITRAEEQQDSALNIVADAEAALARIAGKPKSQRPARADQDRIRQENTDV
jgi:replicative DNA helicase